ncbi:MAG: DsrE/DsrF/DrsH-like family protein [Firmicutes bacterium]|nr:DsrE/DsrF/DrsH-like family protein [Bacillota bacterium]
MAEATAPKLSVVLVSPQLEKLHAAATMTSVAALSGMQVNLFITMEALRMFLKETVEKRDFVVEGEVSRTLLAKEVPLYYQMLADAKESGDMHIYACALAADIMGWKKEEMLEIIDDVIGVSEYFGIALGGIILTM